MKITVLYLEDDPKDVELVGRLLEDSGYESDITVIGSEAALRINLQRTDFDLILSDCALPAYDGIEALSTARQLRPEVPFIFVSGTLGEEVAIECVKGGATDYVLKNRLSRLPPVVARALEEARYRKDHEEIKKKLEEMQQAFYQSQKMETIGRLTGGIAHDFNNMLAVVLGYAEVVQRRTDESDPRYQYAGEIVAASRRAAGLVEQLLSYSRNQRLTPESLRLNDELEAISKMLQRLVGERVSIEISSVKDLWPVDLDRVRFDQVMFNMVANARDAIRDSGSVIITMENRHLESGELPGNSDLSDGDYVQVRVRDTGSGMDPTVLESIFEPFFTTKKNGTGLGLAIAKRIALEHHGAIELQSDPAKGSTFTLALPAV